MDLSVISFLGLAAQVRFISAGSAHLTIRTSAAIGMVMREVWMLVALGVAAGLPSALVLACLIRAQLYGVAPDDLSTSVLCAAGLFLVASAAGYIPAVAPVASIQSGHCDMNNFSGRWFDRLAFAMAR